MLSISVIRFCSFHMSKSFSPSLSSSRFVLKCLFPCISLSLVQYLCVICTFCCAVPPNLRTAAVLLAQHGSEAFVPSLAQFTVNTVRWTCLCYCCLSIHSEVCVCVCVVFTDLQHKDLLSLDVTSHLACERQLIA